MKTFNMARIAVFLLAVLAASGPAAARAKAPPGADLVDLAYSDAQGVAVISRYELFRSKDGTDWRPAGLGDRAVELTAVGLGKDLVLVATDTGLLFRAQGPSPLMEVKAPRDPYGRTITGISMIAVHPEDREILASTGQGVIRSRDKGVTWEAIADPFWKNPDAREVVAISYVRDDPVVVTRKGIYRQSKDSYEPVTGGLPDQPRPTAAASSDGQLLVALPGEGIFLAKKDSKFSKLASAPGDPIAFVGFAGDSLIAARPATSLHRGDLKGRSWSPVGQYSGSFIPVASATTPFGDFLILRGKGLVRLEGEAYVPVELPVELSMVNARLEIQGVQLAGTQGGVYRSTSGGKEWLDVTPEGLGVGVNTFLSLDDGRILLGSDGAGVFISEDQGASWRNWSLRLGTSNTIKELLPYGNGVLAATENGLMWSETGQEPNWQALAGGVGRNSVLAMVREGNRFWLATQTGVFSAADGEDFSPVAGIDGRVNSLAVEKGRVVALVNCRIMVIEKNKNINELKNFSKCTATAVAIMGGTIYAGTNDGLYQWGGSDWTRIGARYHPVARLYPAKGGLRVVTRGAGTYAVP